MGIAEFAQIVCSRHRIFQILNDFLDGGDTGRGQPGPHILYRLLCGVYCLVDLVFELFQFLGIRENVAYISQNNQIMDGTD